MPPLALVRKLIVKLRELIVRLTALQQLNIHRDIDQFYYMQKAEELEFLCEQLAEVEQKKQRIEKLIHEVYGCVALRWKKDLRIFYRHRRTTLEKRPIL